MTVLQLEVSADADDTTRKGASTIPFTAGWNQGDDGSGVDAGGDPQSYWLDHHELDPSRAFDLYVEYYEPTVTGDLPMPRLFVKEDDKGYVIQFTITDADENAYDISGYTVTFKLWAPGVPATLALEGACSVTGATSGQCTFTVAADSFPTPGVYEGELELTQSGVIESTESFPVLVAESG